jgi:hypothetical protein
MAGINQKAGEDLSDSPKTVFFFSRFLNMASLCLTGLQYKTEIMQWKRSCETMHT